MALSHEERRRDNVVVIVLAVLGLIPLWLFVSMALGVWEAGRGGRALEREREAAALAAVAREIDALEIKAVGRIQSDGDGTGDRAFTGRVRYVSGETGDRYTESFRVEMDRDGNILSVTVGGRTYFP